MEDNTKLIKLPKYLGHKINQLLSEKIEFVPRKDKHDFWTYEFTEEELSLIDKLEYINPLSGYLEGIELLPNLKSLSIKSNGRTFYIPKKDLYSISDNDGYSISKCKNLKTLKIENQGKLSYLNLENLKNLRNLNLTGNLLLEELDGLDQLNSLWQLDYIGNESLCSLPGLDKVIVNNEELTDVNLDVLLFPEAIGYNKDGSINEEAYQKICDINASWHEILPGQTTIKINTNQIIKMHKKCINILNEYVPPKSDRRTTVIGIEQYLCENVVYDYNALKNGHSHSSSGITIGPLIGANGAFNAIMFNTCVCEGYTRAMQYLLKLKGIQSHNVHCFGVEDNVHMSSYTNDKYKTYKLPDKGYHSIVSIDDLDYLYDDPCWNASRYQSGDQSMPWALLTKEEISKDHTLSFNETNINNNHLSVSRQLIEIAKNEIDLYRNRKNVKNQPENDNFLTEDEMEIMHR